ncbi:MAG TPA: 50S ribosomal protein L15 [Firmicutes bacterium]|jgi:large subunit ribosomal protein L15|nr:50S ribosomal protein L15 [Candidatus Fermentithermobacillaceae bacterium]
MELHDLRPNPGSVRKAKRKGQGLGSGNGKTAGRGHKGQKARSGGTKGPGFEGGQMRLTMRLPKRGFHNIFGVEYDLVNVGDLDRFEANTEVGPEVLKEAGMLRKNSGYLKILGDGEIKKTLTVKAHAFSKSAKEKIEAAGGKAEVI